MLAQEPIERARPREHEESEIAAPEEAPLQIAFAAEKPIAARRDRRTLGALPIEITDAMERHPLPGR